MSFRFADLWTYKVGDSSNRLPLSRLEPGGHIHGLLEWRIAQKLVPGLGYFGPSDVCFGMWLFELSRASLVLQSAGDAEYLFDEGEQGQPAYRFQRHGERFMLTIVASELSEAEGMPDWGVADCDLVSFFRAVDSLLARFRAHLVAEIPHKAEEWLSQRLRRDA